MPYKPIAISHQSVCQTRSIKRTIFPQVFLHFCPPALGVVEVQANRRFHGCDKTTAKVLGRVDNKQQYFIRVLMVLHYVQVTLL